MRIATGSPRSAAVARSRAIICDSRPRRRWVGETVALVIAPAATSPPGTVSRVANDRNVATKRPPSCAPWMRVHSTSFAKSSENGSTCSGASDDLWKPTSSAACQAGSSERSTVRISTGMAR